MKRNGRKLRDAVFCRFLRNVVDKSFGKWYNLGSYKEKIVWRNVICFN